MSNYTKLTDFAAKDALLSGNPNKLVKGTEIDNEFDAIEAAIITKVDMITSVDNTVPRFDGTGGQIQGSSAVIDDSGNLGLGVTPSAWSTANALKVIDVGNSGAFGSDNSNVFMTKNGYYDGSNWKYKTSSYITHFTQTDTGQFQWHISTSGTAGNNATLTQAMALDASGNLEVGSTSKAAQTTLKISNADGYRPILVLRNATQTWNMQVKSDAGQNWYLISNNSETVGVYMTPSASGWNNLSDERAKENWVELTDATEKISSLRAGTFTWVKDSSLPRDVGVIAQDVLAVLPEAVDTSNPDEYGVRYTHLVPLLIKAIQELTERVAQLEAK